jgi:membrane-associated phospholipid phosphatase
MYFAIQAIGVPTNRIDLSFPFENRWPVLQWTVAIYVSAYLQAPLAVLMAASQRGLRRFAYAGVVASIIVGFCWIFIPAVVTHRPFPNPHGLLGKILEFSRKVDDGTVSFPSMHVMWAFIAADVWTDRSRVTHRPWLRIVGWAWAVAIAITTITTGMHYLLDIFAAVLVYIIVRDPERRWAEGRNKPHRLQA